MPTIPELEALLALERCKNELKLTKEEYSRKYKEYNGIK
jgi:hypothetical protein